MNQKGLDLWCRNKQGADYAVRFRGKFTHVSPVWYQLRTDQEGALVLLGGHDVNESWIAELRAPLTPSLASSPLSSEQQVSASAQSQASVLKHV